MFEILPSTKYVETICSLVLIKPVTHINIDVDVEELVQEKRGQATYPQIKAYVFEHSGLKISSLNIAQVKQKCGIIERENYNKPRSEDVKQPRCTPEKERAIEDAAPIQFDINFTKAHFFILHRGGNIITVGEASPK